MLTKLYVHAICFKAKQKGLTTVEYAVAGGLIAAAVITAFLTLGGTVNGIIEAINGALTA
jgi:pilus assembly protein Flp/PilA